MTRNRVSRLIEAQRDKLIVKFCSPYEPNAEYGYVLDIGPSFFLLGLIGEDIRFNGFQCLRLSDVRQLEAPASYADFVEKALRKRKQRINRKPNIRLTSLPELLISANSLFPLITIHRERVDSETCKIGRVISISKKHLLLLEIGPDAIWDEKPAEIRLSEITRVEFGGDYEEALHLVGGKPRQPKRHFR